MSEIAAAAGVTKPILYKHFGDKGGLYRTLAERYVQRILEELRGALALIVEYLVLPQIAGVRKSLSLLGSLNIGLVALGFVLE
ncbi:MAG: hypothetical protein QOC87_2141, partial [Actinomycetota bacterium]|nr:hypothetical protein [Actinomycetota bacterium]